MIFPNADRLREEAIIQGWRETYNEAMWDWLTANGFTQSTLPDKIRAAELADFDFSNIGGSVAGPLGDGLLLEDGTSFLLAEDNSYIILE